MDKPIDFLAIGDTTTDAFIRLKDAQVNCRVDTGACEICMRFAEKIPYEFAEVVRAVGNAPNAAVSAARLGLSTGLITNMGDDQNGLECAEVLKKEGIDTQYVQVHKGKETNYHYVLWYEADRTILIKHNEYDYALPALVSLPKWLYLSSFRGTERYHQELMKFVSSHPDMKVAFQPGKMEIKLGVDYLRTLYEHTDFFCLNLEEARVVLGNNDEPKKLLEGLHALGPKIVAITDGPKGAYLLDDSGAWFHPIYPDPKPPYERTGAGDAFASTFVAALALGKDTMEALRCALINPTFVVQYVGAQKGLLTRTELEKYLAQAPADFTPQRI
ncbi:MAG: carbohydrate kinase family protein [bacterium]|nr:carbohydrate kinase family protein [bacterium]